MRRRVATGTSLLTVVLTLVLFLSAPQAQATMVLTLSDYSTDETPAEWLHAELAFTVDGDTLTLEVTNLTGNPEGPTFDVSQVYFNLADDAIGLTAMDSDWQLTVAPDALRPGGFGYFDVSLVDQNGQMAIMPGETKAFVLGIIGTASEADFTTSFSVPEGEDKPAGLAAGKFVHGPGDDSAWGQVIPEPATICLLGFGGLCWLVNRKRRV